jgi:FKBP-type peptidyl-prolyl cis-trans isomerase FkpA
MKYTLLFLSLSLVFFSCKPGFKKSPNGLTYKLFAKGSGNKPALNDVIKFQFVMKTDKDSVLLSSYKTGEPGLAQLKKPTYKGDLMEGFGMMRKGDSAVFKISADSFYKNQPNAPYKKGSMLIICIKMLDVKPYADYMKDMQKEAAEAQGKEEQMLQEMVMAKYPTAKKTETGLYYVITKPGAGPNAQKGQEVTAHYRGSLVTGHVFDSDSGRAEPFKFKLGEHQVIAGWDEGFALLNKGAKATLIIPSKLGYGPKGSQGTIPPSATLIFDVELLDAK